SRATSARRGYEFQILENVVCLHVIAPANIMRCMISRRVGFLTLVAGIVLCADFGAQTVRSRNAGADWPMYNRDYAGTRYSPLNQINAGNVTKLTKAWTYRLRREGKTITALSPNEVFQEVTPIVVNGVMYLPAGDRVVALEPETGKE